MREGPEHLPHDDADRPVDRVAEEQPLGQALVAEQVDEADRGQERRRQDRDLGDDPEQAATGHPGAGEAIGIDEGQHDADHGAQSRHGEAVGDRAQECRVDEEALEVREPGKAAVVALEALGEHRHEREQNGHGQQCRQAGQPDAQEAVVAGKQLPHRPTDTGGDRGGLKAREVDPARCHRCLRLKLGCRGTRAGARAAA